MQFRSSPSAGVPAMRCCILLVLSLGYCSAILAADEAAKLPAFPGAEGAGAFALGGRGGKVYAVTTLEDYNPKGKKVEPIVGSLRWAVMQPGPRIVVFRTSGIIQLKAVLKV